MLVGYGYRVEFWNILPLRLLRIQAIDKNILSNRKRLKIFPVFYSLHQWTKLMEKRPLVNVYLVILQKVCAFFLICDILSVELLFSFYGRICFCSCIKIRARGTGYSARVGRRCHRSHSRLVDYNRSSQPMYRYYLLRCHAQPPQNIIGNGCTVARNSSSVR